jgi:hypothetical protein
VRLRSLRHDDEDVRRLILILSIIAAAGITPLRVASAAGRVAVLVAGATAADHDLAAVVSEVVESQVARASDAEIAGIEELRAKMTLTSETEVASCLADLGCLSRAAILLRVRHVITGTVGHSDTEHFFSLEWRDMEDTSAPPRRVFRRVTGGLHELGRSALSAVDELLRPPQPRARLTIEARRDSRVLLNEVPVGVAPLTLEVPGGRQLVRVESAGRFPWQGVVNLAPADVRVLSVTDDQMPMRRSWPTRAVWAGLGVTGLAVATGVMFGALGQRQPEGTTRGEVQRSLQDREGESTVAEAALITAAVTALVTGIIAVRYWDHIVGREARSSR